MQARRITVVSQIPIFPLPNMVFFPKTILPLHIFEPRYRQMVRDTKTGDKLIGMTLLKNGWESDYFGAPEVHEIACVGEIQHSEKLSDGKYNIVLYGLSRIQIVDFVQEEPYRVANVKYFEEKSFNGKRFNEEQKKHLLTNMIERYLEKMGIDNFQDFLKLSNHSLESILNQTAGMLDFTVHEKQQLLEKNDLTERYHELTRLLKDRLTAIRLARNVKFVPDDPTWN